MRSGFGLYREGSTGEGQIIAVQSSRLEKRSYATIFKDINIMLENAAGGGSIRGRDFIDIELHARAPAIGISPANFLFLKKVIFQTDVKRNSSGIY
jgi:hypothetical protein